ncbi:hypothetical protein GCM10028827_06520 [Mucilaginibacter myungsuensis]
MAESKSGHNCEVMKLQLTTDLLYFLVNQDYRYLYSKTLFDEEQDQIRISLTPTQTKPRVRQLPAMYDTFFSINREPVQMAEGIDDQTLVVVELEASLAVAFLDQVLQPLLAVSADSIIINIQAGQEVVQKRFERKPSSPDPTI